MPSPRIPEPTLSYHPFQPTQIRPTQIQPARIQPTQIQPSQNEQAFSRISYSDSNQSHAIAPTLPPWTDTEDLSIQQSSLPWHLSGSDSESQMFDLAKTSTPNPQISVRELLGLSSDSESSPIIERNSKVILALDSQDPTGTKSLVETQHVSDSE